MESIRVPRVQFVEKPLSVWSVEAALHKLLHDDETATSLMSGDDSESRATNAIPAEAI